ncbi:hypothetical protein C2845_PM05G25670 [Panicum miliaceum]|uniref:Uncharacterized protein n=1 Tax=Panicum miliaceum TaxID=4540 RepID=A0A3L6SUZ1_PANMI|nr:hypothetical protein C2845_PM05G25670 [Panicum miliaceum]
MSSSIPTGYQHAEPTCHTLFNFLFPPTLSPSPLSLLLSPLSTGRRRPSSGLPRRRAPLSSPRCAPRPPTCRAPLSSPRHPCPCPTDRHACHSAAAGSRRLGQWHGERWDRGPTAADPELPCVEELQRRRIRSSPVLARMEEQGPRGGGPRGVRGRGARCGPRCQQPAAEEHGGPSPFSPSPARRKVARWGGGGRARGEMVVGAGAEQDPSARSRLQHRATHGGCRAPTTPSLSLSLSLSGSMAAALEVRAHESPAYTGLELRRAELVRISAAVLDSSSNEAGAVGMARGRAGPAPRPRVAGVHYLVSTVYNCGQPHGRTTGDLRASISTVRGLRCMRGTRAKRLAPPRYRVRP